MTATQQDILNEYSPATDELIKQLTECFTNYRAHKHPERGEDWYCLNLVAYMGERMGPVLRRLRDAEWSPERGG
jgi:hypothetical protein